MSNKCILICFAIFLLGAHHIRAQSTSELLKPYIGEWSGEGWHEHTDHTSYFVQYCTINSKLNGEVLLIDQSAYIKDKPDELLFEEIQVWRLENDTTIIAEIYRANRPARESILRIVDGMIIFSRNSDMTFISEIDKNGDYVKTGLDNDRTFFKMTLKKK